MSEQVHNRLAMVRAERKVSRQSLAEAVGAHYQTIGYIERGQYNPSLDLALKIAEYFGLPVEALFSLTPFRPLTDEDYGRNQ
uniref:Helix-turn-helix transcriptional regulator n=1 Tax=Streptomyces sp. NBC_00003 TaxID=2903608 RepID=A0AAU2V432_9ACTN